MTIRTAIARLHCPRCGRQAASCCGKDYAERVTSLEAERDKWHDIAINLAEAVAFYADPDSYFALMITADRPCGAFADDVSEDETYGRHMPGAKARAALALAVLKENNDV